METENDTLFIIRSYTKAELAQLYNPTQCITVALKTLARWISMNPSLMEELKILKYNKYRRVFTPAEIRLIIKYLGEP